MTKKINTLSQNLLLIRPLLVAILVFAATGYAAVTTEAEYLFGDDGVGASNLPLDSSGTGWDILNTTGGATVSSTGGPSNDAYYSFNGGGFWKYAYDPPEDNVGVEAWVRTSNLTQENRHVFGTGHNGNGLALIYDNRDGRGWGGAVGGVAWVGTLGVGNYTAGEWIHLALVRDSGTSTFYVNGAVVGAGSTAAPNNANGDIHIGVSDGGYVRYDGDMAYGRIFTFNPGQFEVADLNNTFDTAQVPDPSDSAAGIEIDLSARTVTGALSWAAPDDYVGATYDVYFGTSEPDELLADYGLTKLTGTPQSETSIAPTAFLPLDYDMEYHWVVDAYDSNTVPVLYTGASWSFTTTVGTPVISAVLPDYTVVAPGADTVLSVTVTDADTLQWYKDGSPISDGVDYSGVTTETLTILGAAVTDEGVYTCTATNTVGTATSDPGGTVYLQQLAMAEYYVSTTGSDTNPGTISAPFLTLTRAQIAVRAILPTATEPVTVWIRGGTYHLDQPLEFGPDDSGTASVPVTYAGYPGETAVFSGAVPLTPTWSSYSGNIQVADIGTGFEFDILFADDSQQVLARYPDYNANVEILNGYASDAISSARVSGWSNPSTGLVRGLHYGLWGGQSYKITGVSNGNPILQWVGDNNRGSSMHSTYRMVENIFEELDAPGEWFYDKTAGQLYFYPPAGLNLSSATIEAASSEELIRIIGSSGSRVRYLTFDNLTFAKTRRTLFTRPYERPLRSDWGVVRAGTVFMQDAENVTVSNSIFDRIGGNGVFMSGYNRNHLITQNEFLENGATCVSTVGLLSAVRYPSSWQDHKTDIQDTTPGPLTDDYPKDITISYNHMANNGRFEKQTSGVNISMSESITVSHNTVHGSPRAGINVCDGTWGGHLFEFNDVFHCVRETSDHGPFNSWGRDRFWSYLGYNTTGSNGLAKKPYAFLDAWKTTIIRNNRFHYSEPRVFGIDLDDGSGNYEVYNNLCLNTGIKLREGFGRKVYNNIMINNRADFHVWYDGCEDQFYHNIIVNNTAYRLAYLDASNMPAKQAMIDNNLFFNAGEPVSIGYSEWTSQGFDVHSVTANPLFTSPLTMDYSVQSGSPALALGFVNFPMDQFGKPGSPQPDPIDFVTGEEPPSDAEPLMGASAASIYDDSVQSALGAPDQNGVYLESVPSGSYAAGQGFQMADVIRTINGTTITTKQSFWTIYHSIAPGETVSVTLLRNQIDGQPFTFVKMPEGEELNDSAGVSFTGSWQTVSDSYSFNGDLRTTQVSGDYFELTFYGNSIAFTSQKNTNMGQIDIYLDGTLDQTVNCYNATQLYHQDVYRKTGLPSGIHTLRVVNSENKPMVLDSITISYDHNVVVSTSQSDTMPTASSNDLAQTQFWASSAMGGNDAASEHAALFNGQLGNTDTDTADTGEVTMDSSNAVTVEFDTSVNTLGYDVTKIGSIFGWSIASNGRSNQGYEIILTFMDDSTWTLAGPEHWETNSPASYWTTVSFVNASGGPMARGVKAMTFDITENANAGGVVVGREIDIFGTPSTVDINGDLTINMLDMAELAVWWGCDDCRSFSGCLGADINSDGVVDIEDLNAVALQWLN